MAGDGRGPEGPRASRARIAVDDLDTGFIWLTALATCPSIRSRSISGSSPRVAGRPTDRPWPPPSSRWRMPSVCPWWRRRPDRCRLRQADARRLRSGTRPQQSGRADELHRWLSNRPRVDQCAGTRMSPAPWALWVSRQAPRWAWWWCFGQGPARLRRSGRAGALSPG